MRFNLRLTILSVVVLLAVASCAGIVATWTPPEGCDATNSLILEHFGSNTKPTDIAIRLGNAMAISQLDLYTREQCIKTVDMLIVAVEKGITGAVFHELVYQAARELNVNFDMELLIISESLQIFANDYTILSPCDQVLILGNLRNIKRDVSRSIAV